MRRTGQPVACPAPDCCSPSKESSKKLTIVTRFNDASMRDKFLSLALSLVLAMKSGLV